MPLDDFLPEGFAVHNMTARELRLTQWFLEDQRAVLDAKIREILADYDANEQSPTHITPDNRLCVRSIILRRFGYEPGDTFEHAIEQGELYLTLVKKTWESPEWLDNDNP
jgi:hypothetical protein